VSGQVDPENVPITEICPQKPSSPYTVSKTAQGHFVFIYCKLYGLKVVTTRIFDYSNLRSVGLFSTSFCLVGCLD
jgi:dTDP-D-glucose 4,6-dehydratase